MCNGHILLVGTCLCSYITVVICVLSDYVYIISP